MLGQKLSVPSWMWRKAQARMALAVSHLSTVMAAGPGMRRALQEAGLRAGKKLGPFFTRSHWPEVSFGSQLIAFIV